MSRYIISILFLIIFTLDSSAQYMDAESKYIGLKPKTDYDPYQNSTSTVVNVLPFIFEYRIEEYKGVQIRPIFDLSFGGGVTQISDFGLTGAYNIYFSDAIKRDYFIKPNIAAAFTYNYNKLGKYHSIALSVEPGVSFLFNPNFLMTVGINPSLGYFIGKSAKAATGSSTGFKAGWGMFLHLGYNMFNVMY